MANEFLNKLKVGGTDYVLAQREIKVNGATVAQNYDTGAVDFVSGSNVTVAASGKTITISAATPAVPQDGALYLQLGTNAATKIFSANQSSASTATITLGSLGASEFTPGTFQITAGSNTVTYDPTSATPQTMTITASDLGLAAALRFVGVSSTNPTVEGATVEGHTTWLAGDVVLYGNKEYLLKANGNDKTHWIELGDESSFVLKGTYTTASAGGHTHTLSNVTVTATETVQEAAASNLVVASAATAEIGTGSDEHTLIIGSRPVATGEVASNGAGAQVISLGNTASHTITSTVTGTADSAGAHTHDITLNTPQNT